MRNWICVITALLVFSTAMPLAAEPQEPVDLVAEIASSVLTKLNARREHFEQHPEELELLVETDLMVLFDLDRSARLILGRHGRTATAEQIKAFTESMRALLVSRYANGLLRFKSSDQLEILPLKGKNSDRLTRVRTRVKLDSGGFAPVDYAFRKSEAGWKAFDVTVEGISYVITYRNQIGPQIQQNGLDAVIEKLQQGELPLNE